MYKLTVISGPNRGTGFPLQEGETTIGRQTGNTIVLPSTKISKRHCVISVSQREISIRDEGSSNGTFVNGALAASKSLKVGDRISIGEFVLEISEPPKRVQKPAPISGGVGNSMRFKSNLPSAMARPAQQRGASPSRGSGNQMAGNFSHLPGIGDVGVPGMGSGFGSGLGSGMQSGQTGIHSSSDPSPKDLKGRLIWFFENRFMPIFYGANLKYEWRALGLAVFSVFILGNLVVSVYPLLESNRAGIVKEATRRAKFMARLIAEQNTPFLAAHAETKTDVGLPENADGVRVAVLMDLDSRIIAPASKLNQYLTSGVEGTIAVKGKELYQAGRETGFSLEADPSTVVAVEPVKVLNPSAGRNQVIAMALVSIDTSISTPDLGEMGMVYSETLILTSLLGGFLLLILYRLTLKPFEVLNEDMDKALKGELGQVTHEFRLEELNPLWEIINSAVQRIPRGSASGGDALGESLRTENFVEPLKILGNIGGFGLVLFDGDRKIVHLNSTFEEMSGIRADQAVGQAVSDVARDQAMGAFMNDLMDRAPIAAEGIAEDYEFSGVAYKVQASAFGSPGGMARCYMMCVAKAAEG